MFIFFLFLVLTLLFLVMIAGTFFISSTLWKEFSMIGKPNAPFVPLKFDAVTDLVSYIPLDSSSVVYDLGCGDGRVLKALYQKEKRARFVGIEWMVLPYVLALWNTRGVRSQNFVIKRADFFTQNISNGTHIITYLFPKLLDQLLPKFSQELKPGTHLYSIDFQFSHKKPVTIIDFPPSSRLLGKKLFIYQF